MARKGALWSAGYLVVSPCRLFDSLRKDQERSLEWTHDRYSATYYQSSPTTDPEGPALGDERTWRDCTFADAAVQCRFAVRRFAKANTRANHIGLRPVISTFD